MGTKMFENFRNLSEETNIILLKTDNNIFTSR